jgi:inorganic phosphate transporter, PiT family
MEPQTALILAIIITGLALIFGFTNGFNDSASQVATVITSNALSPEKALGIAAVGNFIGAYFLGTAVAETLGKGIVDPSLLDKDIRSVLVIAAALIGAIVWNIITWRFGIPSSSSHALIGGLAGAFLVGLGYAAIHWVVVWRIVLVMIASPLVGFIVTFAVTNATFLFARWFTPKANRSFKRLQIFSLAAQSLSHGTNDAQKIMGIVTLALIILGLQTSSAGSFVIPAWVIIICALSISAGTMTGGWRIIKKLGTGLYKVRPVHAFASQVASSVIIYITAALGYPISTTQVISSSVMGAGAASRFKMVRWQVANDMMIAWLVTIPASALVAAITFFALDRLV